MSPSVRIAAVQARPVSDLFDDMWTGGDVARAVELLEAAARGGAVPVILEALTRREDDRRRLRAAIATLDEHVPSMRALSPAALKGTVRLPRIESYLSKCASVAVSVMSLTATTSTSWCARAARRMLRPIRPKPLMPTLMAMTRAPPNKSFYNRFRTHSVSPSMYSLYSVLVLAVAVIASPWFVYQALRYKKYVGSLGQRLGYLRPE